MESPFECVLDAKASLGECPVWSIDEQVLYWVDINAPSLNRFHPESRVNLAWPMPSVDRLLCTARTGRIRRGAP